MLSGNLTIGIAAAMLVALLLAYHLMRSENQPLPAAGTPAPDFTLTSEEGKAVRLSDFRGQWVVLYFYPKDFTSGCTVEAHNFQRDLAEYEKRNAAIVGVSVQSADTHKSFCAKEGLHFKLLADEGRKVSALYGSLKNYVVTKLSARNTFLIDPDGVIRKVYTDVRPGTHSRDVIAELDELRANRVAK